MIKVGRITASLLIIAVGLMLLYDRLYHTHTIALLTSWWSLILIALGIEIVWYSFRSKGRKRKLDALGIFTSIFIAAIVFTITQPNLFQDWVRSIQFDFSMMKQMVKMDGTKSELPSQSIFIPTEVKELKLELQAGDIYAKKGSQDHLEVEAILTIYNAPSEQVKSLAQFVQIRWVQDEKEPVMRMKVDGLDKVKQAGYASRVDLNLLLPRERSFVLDARTKEGDLYIHNLVGTIQADTLDGDIAVSNIVGEVYAHSSTGDIDIKDVSEGVEAKAANGDLNIKTVGGDTHLFTKSGDIDANELLRGAYAETYSGDIFMGTSSLDGDWTVTTLAGDVHIELPKEASAATQAKNSFGDLSSDFPLTIVEHEMQGVIGEGLYRVMIQANGDIDVSER